MSSLLTIVLQSGARIGAWYDLPASLPWTLPTTLEFAACSTVMTVSFQERLSSIVSSDVISFSAERKHCLVLLAFNKTKKIAVAQFSGFKLLLMHKEAAKR